MSVSVSLSLCLVLSHRFSRRIVFVLRTVMEESGHFALAVYNALRASSLRWLLCIWESSAVQ